jgi:hypothetical protein
MTTVVVLAEPPVAGETLPELHDVVTPAGANSLYTAMLRDVCEVLQHGQADLLVNHPPSDRVPEGVDPEAALREAVQPAVPAPEDVRYEVQVGSSRAARVGNALTHLLETEGVETAGVLEPTTPFLGREHVGSAAMKLRSSAVVVGPATGGRIAFAAFREPIDFTDVFAPPAVETLTDRAVGAGHEVDFLPVLPQIESADDLATAAPILRARAAAGRLVPARTAAVIQELELSGAASGTEQSDSS